MSNRRTITTNSTAVYLVVAVIIVVAFLLLGGGPWIRGMMHGSRSIGIAHWNWVPIIISLVIGLLLGLAASKRKW